MSDEGTVRRQERSAPVVNKVLKVTCDIINRGGEQALTIAEVRERTGVTIGSIYHHFGSREGLVAAAYANIYGDLALREVELLRGLTANVKNATEFEKVAKTAVATIYGDAETPNRIKRMTVIAAAQHRPLLKFAIAQKQDEATAALVEWVSEMQSRGFYNKEINPHSLAVLLQAIPFGRVIDAVANDQLGDADFAVLCGRVLAALQSK